MILYENGIQGLSDSLFAGSKGSAHRLVGVDYRSTPGLIKVQQKLSKHSGTTVDEFCKVSLAVSDGSTLWFSSTSGKIWREVSGTYTLVHTTVPTSGTAGCTGAEEYDGDVYWATEDYIHRIVVSALGGAWSEQAEQNYGKFKDGIREHPMAIQNLDLFIGDGREIARVRTPIVDPNAPLTNTVSFSSTPYYFCEVWIRPPDGVEKYPEYRKYTYTNVGSSVTGTQSFTVENGASKKLIVIVSQYLVGGTPAVPTGVTFGGVPMTARYANVGGASASGNNERLSFYEIDVGAPTTANVVVTWAGTETANRKFIIMQFNGAKQSGDAFFLGAGTVSTGTSASVTQTGSSAGPYRVKGMLATTINDVAHTQNIEYVPIQEAGTTRISIGFHTLGVSMFDPTSALALKAPEYITDLHPFDVDLLIGTKIDNTNKARVLRWDTESSAWNAEDDVEEDGINAFIRDDNYVYVSAGNYGRLYFYDGEKLMPYTKMPGDWSPSKQATIHRNAVAFHMGIPVFGISNVTGNPTLQGVYGFGKYSKDYRPTLSLDFPISENVFSTIEIGAILVKGADMFVSWKNGATFGVDKLDWSNKYTGAYIETPVLTALGDRSNLKTLVETWCDYYALPANTNVRMYFIKKHGDSFAELTTRNDSKLLQLRARVTHNDVSSLRLRFDFVVSGNNAPEVENFGVAMGMRKERV